MVALEKAKRIKEFYFPFPYAQTLTTLLVLLTFVQPVIAAIFITSPTWCAALTFLSIFTLWSINYVAHEIERPFGDGNNDLPLMEMQTSFNQSLKSMLERQAKVPPAFAMGKVEHHGAVSLNAAILPSFRPASKLLTMPSPNQHDATLQTMKSRRTV